MFPIAAIFGHPVRHSRSPQIHGTWLHHYRRSGAYLIEDVAPDQLADRLKNFSASGLAGANLTLPLKELACKYVELDEIASAIGAVNVIWLEGGQLRGTNTDVHGFVASLDEQAPRWRKALENVVVLGAGGAAKAVVYGLLQAGAETVTLVNRDAGRAEAVQKLFGKKVKRETWDEIAKPLAAADLLVNATSLGMTGEPPLALDVGLLPKTAIVADIVYSPLETNLLHEARKQGLATAEGLSMLLHQAAPAFARWFGVTPQVTAELRNMIAAGLSGEFVSDPIAHSRESGNPEIMIENFTGPPLSRG